MTLVSKHTSGELSSPFYVENKEKCEEYESFIQEIGGESKGYYNAYSYNAMGTVDSTSKWQLRLKKATRSSTAAATIDTMTNWYVTMGASEETSRSFYRFLSNPESMTKEERIC